MHLLYAIAPLLALTGAPLAPADEENLACGPRCVSVAAGLLERPIAQKQLAVACSGRLQGTHSLGELKWALQQCGLHGAIIVFSKIESPPADLPVIAAVRRSPASPKPDHFVVLYGRREKQVQVIDFPYAPRWVPLSELRKEWDGSALVVAASRAQLSQVPGLTTWPADLIGSALAGGIMLASLAGLLRTRRHAPKNPDTVP